jgi:hypothetical protein
MDLQQLSPDDANKGADDDRETIEFRGVLLRIELSLVRLWEGQRETKNYSPGKIS